MTSYTGIGCTHLFGAILLFYRHPAGEYRESRNEYCYIIIYWTFDPGSRQETGSSY